MQSKLAPFILLWQWLTGCYYNNLKNGLKYTQLHLDYLSLNYPYKGMVDIVNGEIDRLTALKEKYDNIRNVKYLARVIFCAFSALICTLYIIFSGNDILTLLLVVIFLGCFVILIYTPHVVIKRYSVVRHIELKLIIFRQCLLDNNENLLRLNESEPLELSSENEDDALMLEPANVNVSNHLKFSSVNMDDEPDLELTIVNICNHLLDIEIITAINKNNPVVQYIAENKNELNRCTEIHKKELGIILSALIHDVKNSRQKGKKLRRTSVFNLNADQKKLSEKVASFLFKEKFTFEQKRASLYQKINEGYNINDIESAIKNYKGQYPNLFLDVSENK